VNDCKYTHTVDTIKQTGTYCTLCMIEYDYNGIRHLLAKFVAVQDRLPMAVVVVEIVLVNLVFLLNYQR
jgi:hypothetical protein